MNRNPVGGRQILKAYATLCREPLYWCYTLTAAFSALAYFAYLGGAPFIAADLLSLSSGEMGFYFMFVALGYIAGNFISGRYSERVGLFPMILAGTLIAIVCVAVIAGFTYFGALSAPSLFLPMFLLGLGNGVCLPSALSGAASVRPELTGAASGMTASFQVSMGALAGSIVAWLYAHGMLAGSPWGMILVMGVGIGFSLMAALSIRFYTARSDMVAAE